MKSAAQTVFIVV